MFKQLLFLTLSLFACFIEAKEPTLQLTNAQAQVVGDKIWNNETTYRFDQPKTWSRHELLTFWNQEEPFPSIGIGHFIWPPENYTGPFSEGKFHKVIAYIKSKTSLSIPRALCERYCPWKTREDFYKNFHSPEMQEIRDFLWNNRGLQLQFMLEHVNKTIRDILAVDPSLSDTISALLKEPNGPYTLVDYLNFKLTGLDPKQRYNGQGWGLMQVLQNMKNHPAPTSCESFSFSARYLLILRVLNSPVDENQHLWIPNWVARTNSYRSV